MPRFLTPTAIDDFREQLCDAAAQLLSEVGYEGFRMRELGKKFGVSTMTPYRYFRDKNEILDVLRARAFRRLGDQIDFVRTRPGSTTDGSIALGDAYVRFAKEEHVYYRLMFDLSQTTNRRNLASRPEEMRVRSIFAAYAYQALDTSQKEAEPIGLMLWAALHGVVSLFLSGRLCEAELDRMVLEIMPAITSTCSRSMEKVRYKLHSVQGASPL